MNGKVYMIVSPTYRIYIGSTVKSLKERWGYYRRLNCKTQIKLYNSLKKYGFENHKFIKIWEGNIKDMYKMENYYGIKFDVLNSQKGLNCRLPKNSDVYYSISKDTIMKISNSLKGRKLSEEHKLNVGKALKNPTKEVRIKMSNSKKNMSKETKIKMSNAQKKKIIQMDLEGNFIKEWDSASDASKELNIVQSSISSCCLGKVTRSKNFKFKFK